MQQPQWPQFVSQRPLHPSHDSDTMQCLLTLRDGLTRQCIVYCPTALHDLDQPPDEVSVMTDIAVCTTAEPKQAANTKKTHTNKGAK